MTTTASLFITTKSIVREECYIPCTVRILNLAANARTWFCILFVNLIALNVIQRLLPNCQIALFCNFLPAKATGSILNRVLLSLEILLCPLPAPVVLLPVNRWPRQDPVPTWSQHPVYFNQVDIVCIFGTKRQCLQKTEQRDYPTKLAWRLLFRELHHPMERWPQHFTKQFSATASKKNGSSILFTKLVPRNEAAGAMGHVECPCRIWQSVNSHDTQNSWNASFQCKLYLRNMSITWCKRHCQNILL